MTIDMPQHRLEQLAQELADSTITGGNAEAYLFLNTLVAQIRSTWTNTHGGIASADDVELQELARDTVQTVTRRAAELVNQHRARPL